MNLNEKQGNHQMIQKT